MIVVQTIEELREARAGLSGKVGLVPTMGYLHEGHFSLVKRAQKECQSVVVSIFVNPTQFGPSEDFASYPRDLTKDLDALKKMNVDIVWTPTEQVMYGEGYQTWVTVEDITSRLEGEIRPGHFKGVTTVVAKLFNAVQPYKAFFGQKDAQQAQVIRRMINDLNFPIEMVVCPIIREADGLALSSRNTYLSPDERTAATVLHQTLDKARAMIDDGQRDAKLIKGEMEKIFKTQPLAKVQYIAIVDPATFLEVNPISKNVLILLAVYIGKVRLIDNLIMGDI